MQHILDANETLGKLFARFGCKMNTLNIKRSKYESFHGRAGGSKQIMVLCIPKVYDRKKEFKFKEYKRLADLGIIGTMRDCLDALVCHEYAHVICQEKGLAKKLPHGAEFRAVYKMCRDEIGLDKRETVKPIPVVFENEMSNELAALFASAPSNVDKED